ncbi:MAG: ATP-binding protein [Candidatus Limnocylindrales bacterium]|jgi:PAS domain S-box-containing protein
MDTNHDPKPISDTASASPDEPRGEEYVAALAARERAEYALRGSEARYRQALLATQAALTKAEALYRVAGSLVAAEPVEAILQRLVEAVADVLDADGVNLFGLDMDRRLVTGNYRAGPGAATHFQVGFDELMDGLAGWVMRERVVALSPGGVRDPREAQHVHDRRWKAGHGPMMVAPIFYRDSALGVIVVTNKPDGREFEQADVDLLSAMASQSAVSIETAVLGEMLEAARSDLEARVIQRTAALAESEDRYRRITETITDYVFHVDLADGNVVATKHGPGCVAVTGYSPEEFDADTGLWLDMVLLEDRELVLEQAREVESNRRMRAIEHRIVRKDGAVRWVRPTPVPQYAPDGSLIGYDGLIQDVTERRALQEQLSQAQKLQSIGRLAGGVAHDFNNLLTAILGNAELAMMDLETNHPARASIEEITKAAEGAARLTRQLLSFARRQMIEPVALDLGAVVEGSVEMLRRLLGEDIEITAVLDGHLGIVQADPGQIQQVLVNLTVNARDAMPEGGRLVIETANQVIADEYVSTRPEISAGRYVTLSVTDTGTGMSDEVLSHLFEPFFTTKPQGSGTGLGLATCHGIVKQSGGHIWVHSELGQGTTVTILLPQAAPRSGGAGEPSAPQPPARGTETILVVEDEPSVRRLAVLGLRSNGYMVLEAANAAEALRIAATEHDIALVVSDVIMPGMHGPELAARLSKVRPKMKVLLTSGHADAPEAFRDAEGRAIPFLAKPFTPDRLAHRVRAVLDGAS